MNGYRPRLDDRRTSRRPVKTHAGGSKHPSRHTDSLRGRPKPPRHQQQHSSTVTAILLVSAALEIVIYFIYRSYDDRVVGSFDRLLNGWIHPESSRGITIVMTEEDLLDVAATLGRTSSSLGYGDTFTRLRVPSSKDEDGFYQYSSKEEMGVSFTMKVLEHMGVNRTELIERKLLHVVPPWWQILENYGNKAIVLGLERCEAFRERVSVRHVAPAGLFSSGTNVLQQLLYDNCVSPTPGQRQRLFNLWQSPWGKHNPAFLRLKHIAKNQEARNQSAVLPVVTIRHPYTWLYALCQSSYSLFWEHRQDFCDRALFLEHPVRADFGSTLRNMTYDSLIHTWRDWYLEYFQQTDYPMLVVRMEDLVFRPKDVIEQVCHCAGGTLRSEIHPTTEPFLYVTESANLGKGHGNHRSDLLSAFIRYGQPLHAFQTKFSEQDWRIINETLEKDRGLSKALKYRLLK